MEEETLFKNRLACDERNIKRCIKKYQAFNKAIEENLSFNDVKLLFEQLQLELSQTEATLSCFEITSMVFEEEKFRLEQEFDLIDEKIKNATKAICSYKKDLTKEKEIRKQKLEYDETSKKILEYKSRSDLQESISALNEEMVNLKKEREAQDQCTNFAFLKLHKLLKAAQDYENVISSIENSPSDALQKLIESDPTLLNSEDIKIPTILLDIAQEDANLIVSEVENADISDGELIETEEHHSNASKKMARDDSGSNSLDKDFIVSPSGTSLSGDKRKRTYKFDQPSPNSRHGEDGEVSPDEYSNEYNSTKAGIEEGELSYESPAKKIFRRN